MVFGKQSLPAEHSRMARGLDEEEAAVDPGILDVSLSLSGELLAQICRMLVLDVLDNWIPAMFH